MSDNEIDPELSEEARGQAEALARMTSSPDVIARALGQWLRTKVPDRLAEAMWITVEGDRDKGLEVRIYERKLERWPKIKARLNALLGTRTAGVDLSFDLLRLDNGAVVAVGAGLVAPFKGMRNLSPVAVVSVRF